MRVIGTAGHVDHGKSALVAALTGTHPDRLKEEQIREMTIDLGFAWFTLPDGEEVGVVDVPGHRDFIENMLSGVGGIDAALFVVAADEGVMPQTREHLAILDLLQIPGGVIVITKIDLVNDPDWLELIEEDIRQITRGTVLEKSPFVRVSAKNGSGIPELMQVMMAELANKPYRIDVGRPRLPVDRVFSIQGFGTIVTGTLLDGTFRVGDEVEVLPSGEKCRIRGLQSHKQKVIEAVCGSRTAVNLSGIETQQVTRGDVIAKVGNYQPTMRLDVRFKLLADATQPLKHNETMKLFIGASEIITRIRLLETDQLLPGTEGWLQLETRSPIVAMRGDRYILRRPSPGETIGGGVVVDPHARRRYKRFDQGEIQRLSALLQGDPVELLFQIIRQKGFGTVEEVTIQSHLPEEMASETLLELVDRGKVKLLDKKPDGSIFPDRFVATGDRYDLATSQLLDALNVYHKKYELRRGMPKEELRAKLGFPQRVFHYIIEDLISRNLIESTGGTYCIAGFTPVFNKQQQQRVDVLLETFVRSKYTPPSVKECLAEVGEEIFAALLEMGILFQVSHDVVFRKEDYDELVLAVRKHFDKEALLTVAQFRDAFSTTRRYALAFLEHLDTIGVTVRDGDNRKLVR